MSDWEKIEWHCTAHVEVHVTDINDNAPMFELHQYSVTVQENSPANTVIAKVAATDADDGTTALTDNNRGKL